MLCRTSESRAGFNKVLVDAKHWCLDHFGGAHTPRTHCTTLQRTGRFHIASLLKSVWNFFTSATCPQLDHSLDKFVPYDNVLTHQFTFTLSSFAFTFDFYFFIDIITRSQSRITRFTMLYSLIASIISLIALVSHTTFTTKLVNMSECTHVTRCLCWFSYLQVKHVWQHLPVNCTGWESTCCSQGKQRMRGRSFVITFQLADDLYARPENISKVSMPLWMQEFLSKAPSRTFYIFLQPNRH